jgi:hypothetical protein
MAGLRDRGHEIVLLSNSDVVLERAQAVDSIPDALHVLYENPQRRNGLGVTAARLAETCFSFDAMLDQWEAFLSSPLPRKSANPARSFVY